MLFPELTNYKDVTNEPGQVIIADNDTVLMPGDRVRFTLVVRSPSLFGSVEKSIMLNRLEDKYPIKILGTTTKRINEIEYYYILARVYHENELPPELQDQAGPVTVGLIVAAIIGGGLLLYINLDKVEKITDSPAGQAALVGAGAAGIGVAVVAAIVLIGLIKK